MSATEFQVRVGDSVCRVEKIDGRWAEGAVLSGDTPLNWGSKTYMGYLTPDEIAEWFRRDYDAPVEVVQDSQTGDDSDG